MIKKKKKIGEILVDSGFITRQTLDRALKFQSEFGGTITHYLISGGYVKEEEVARCISIQFGYPYLPIRAYDIPAYVVERIPGHLAQKYLLMPVDKIGNIITLVMADPLDEEAINEVEKATNCKVQSFVGIISDIAKAVEKYYGLNIEEVRHIKPAKEAPLFVAEEKYSGAERRKSVRIKTNIEVHFPIQKSYEKSTTKDVSMHGFLFESKNILPLKSFLTLEINLPKEFSPHPIAAVVQVVRVVPLKNGNFDIGVETIDMSAEDINKVVQCALLKKYDST